jgi:hypothetical protein
VLLVSSSGGGLFGRPETHMSFRALLILETLQKVFGLEFDGQANSVAQNIRPGHCCFLPCCGFGHRLNQLSQPTR